MIHFFKNYWAFLIVLPAYFAGMCLDVLDVDSAQYAYIGKEMLQRNEFLQVFELGQPYLDKPPLLFWTSALSYFLFGVSPFAFRLIPHLVGLLGIYAVFCFTKSYYGQRAAQIAALLTASCQAYFLMHHDLRTDAMLASFTIVGLWQIAEFNRHHRLKNLLFGFLAVGLAMLAKGPIAAVVPVAAFTVDFALKRQWSNFFRWQWLVGLAVVGLVLSAMCVGLYRQYGSEGLYFYFWKQSFGRITGENVWQNDADIFFLSHSFLWSFLPWTLFFPPALYVAFRQIIKQKFRLTAAQEAISLGGFVLPFIALSTSRYQLPHYSFVVFPLAAVLTARYIDSILENAKTTIFRFFVGFQAFVCVLLFALLVFLILYCFPMQNFVLWLVIILFFIASFYFLFAGKTKFETLIYPSLFAICGLNLGLNLHFYPSLFDYQTGSKISHYLNQNGGAEAEKLYIFGQDMYMPSLGFHRNQKSFPIELKTTIALSEMFKNAPCWFYTNTEGFEELKRITPNYNVETTFDRFHVSTLDISFLMPNTRNLATKKMYLIRIN